MGKIAEGCWNGLVRIDRLIVWVMVNRNVFSFL